MIPLHFDIRTKAPPKVRLLDALAVALALSMITASARAGELGGQKYQQPRHAMPLVPQAEPEHKGVVQKQGAQLPAPGTYNCLNQPKASQNTHTLSSANPLPEKKGQLIGKLVYGKAGEEVGKVQAEVTPQGCDVTAVLVNIGGFIGIGGKQVQIPMSDLKQEGDRLVATSMTAKDIKNMPPVTARKDPNRNAPGKREGAGKVRGTAGVNGHRREELP